MHQMLGDWFDAASTVIAFTKHSGSSVESHVSPCVLADSIVMYMVTCTRFDVWLEE